jgi:hypothetical protein
MLHIVLEITEAKKDRYAFSIFGFIQPTLFHTEMLKHYGGYGPDGRYVMGEGDGLIARTITVSSHCNLDGKHGCSVAEIVAESFPDPSVPARKIGKHINGYSR